MKEMISHMLSIGIRCAALAGMALALPLTAQDNVRYRFSAAEYRAFENTGTVRIAIHREGNTREGALITYRVDDPAEALAGRGCCFGGYFASGATESVLEFVTRNDNFWNEARVVTLQIIAPGGTPAGTARLTIENDDPPVPQQIRVRDIVVVEQTSGLRIVTTGFPMTVPPSLGSRTLTHRSVDGTATYAADYYAGAVEVPVRTPVFPNQTDVTSSFMIVPDREHEPDETFQIELTLGDLPQTRVSAVILNDDRGIVAPREVTLTERFEVQLDFGPTLTQAVTVDLTTVGGLEAPASIAVPAGARLIRFPVRATSTGAAALIAKLPESIAADTLTAGIYVSDDPRPAFLTAQAVIARNGIAYAQIALSPAQTAPATVTLRGPAAVTMPSQATIPPGGYAVIPISGATPGRYTIEATVGARVATFVLTVSDPMSRSIANVSPNSGPTAGGTRVRIASTGLSNDCTVSFGGVEAATAAVTSEAIEVTTPAFLSGSADIALRCGSEPPVTLPAGFRFEHERPVVTAVAPAAGNVSGGTLVRISGSNFLPGCGVTFDGVLARGVIIESSTTIVAAAPAHAAGRAAVGIRCESGEASLPDPFTWVAADEPPPAIASVALEGAPGDLLEIHGTRFRPTDSVTFGRAKAQIIRTTPDRHVVLVPELTPATVAIAVTDTRGRVSTTGPIFAVTTPAAPVVFTVTPSTAVAGGEVELEGSGFRAGLRFIVAGAEAEVIALTPRRVTLRVPAGVQGNGPIELRSSSPAVYGPAVIVRAAGLTVRHAMAPCAPESGGTTVMLTGSGFSVGARVTFDGIEAPGVAVVSSEMLRVITPASMAGPATILVTNPDGGRASLTGRFSFTSAFQPDSGCSGRTRAVRR